MLSIHVITLAFLIGIIWGIYLEIKILNMFLIFLSIFSLIYLKKHYKSILILMILCLTGALYANFKINEFDNKYENEMSLNLKVTILTHIEETDFYYKYICKSSCNDKFILLSKKSAKNIFNIGDVLNISGEFNLPNISRNRGGFNYRRTLNSEGIYGNIKAKNILKIGTNDANIVYVIQNLVYDNFNKIFPKEYAGILSGMIIGETSLISESTNENFKKAGVTHLLAVSGSNVALVITFSSYIFAKVFGKKYSDFISIVFVIFFMFLAGASPSVMRAGIMAILSLLANILVRKPYSIVNVFSSALIILIFNPLSIFNMGFILSFVRNNRDYNISRFDDNFF